MTKSKKWFIAALLTATVLASVSTFVIIKGLKQDFRASDFDSKVVSQEFLKNFNDKQVKIFNNYKPFLHDNKTDNLLLNRSYNVQQTRKKSISDADGNEIKVVNEAYITKQKQPSSYMDINNFFTQYNKEDVKNVTNYESWLKIILPIKYNTYYNSENLEVFADIQTIILKIISDLNSNSYFNSMLSKQFMSGIFYKFSWIRSQAWIKQELQKQFFKTVLLAYLNFFYLDIKDIEIDWKNTEDQLVSFSISKVYDTNGKNILRDENTKKVFYIPTFRDYKTDAIFGVGQDLDDSMDNLFNEYLVNPLLTFNKNIFGFYDINYILKSIDSLEFFSARSFNYWLNNWGDHFINIPVPEYKKNEDKSYRFVSSELTSYYNTDQILKIKIEVTKLDGSKVYYWWLSSAFDDHGHKMKGLIKNLKTLQELKQYTPDLELVDSTDLYEYDLQNIAKVPDFEGISVVDFANSSLFKAIAIYSVQQAHTMKQNINDLSWDDETKIVETWLNIISLQYAIGTQKGDIHTGVNHLKVKSFEENNRDYKLVVQFVDKNGIVLLEKEIN
ncbi:MAG3240 family lipoprotein [Mycoplasma sp. 392]